MNAESAAGRRARISHHTHTYTHKHIHTDTYTQTHTHTHSLSLSRLHKDPELQRRHLLVLVLVGNREQGKEQKVSEAVEFVRKKPFVVVVKVFC